jgi:hypothetical protein
LRRAIKLTLALDRCGPLAGELASCTTCRTQITEIAQQVSGEANSLSELRVVETTSEHLRRAHQTQRTLTGRGLQGRKIPDLLIAAAAEQEQLTLLHYGADFHFIAAATGQKCESIVPRGSVD